MRRAWPEHRDLHECRNLTMRTARRAIAYFRDDLWRIILSQVLMGCSIVLGLLWPLPLAILIDRVLQTKAGDYWVYRWWDSVTADTSAATRIVILAAAMFLIRLLSIVLQTWQTLINIRVGYNGLMRARNELFRKLQALSLSYHKSQPQGDAIHRLAYATLGFQSVLNVVVGIAVNSVTLIAIAAILFGMNWKLTLVSLAVIPPIWLTIHWYGSVLRKIYLESYKVDSEVTTAIQRSVASIGLVQAFGREHDEFANFAATHGNSIRFKMYLHWHEVMYHLVLGAIFAVGACAILGYGGWLAWQGTLSAGALMTFLIYLEKLYDPLSKLSGSNQGLQSALTAAEKVFEVLDREPVIRDAPDAIALPAKPRTLCFRDVSFEYEPGKPILRRLNVTIMPGQMVAFVGSSGVGKTTLLNLLPRFYDPTAGAITLDEYDLRKVRLADLRKHVALVLQDSIILPTTIAENIAYGRPTATDAQIRRAAELAGAAAFIEKLDKQYETNINESGSNLSGGQKQRISIARALITEAPIIVLDEPTSALDPQHEQLVTETLRRLKGQRTIIIVSHRLSTVADCDQIFVMEEGRIVEHGTHDELVARRGVYFAMAKHQMKLEERQPETQQRGAQVDAGF